MNRLTFKIFFLLIATYLSVIAIGAGFVKWQVQIQEASFHQQEHPANRIANELIKKYNANELENALIRLRKEHQTRAWILAADQAPHQNTITRRPPPHIMRQITHYPMFITPRDKRHHQRANFIYAINVSDKNNRTFHVILASRHPLKLMNSDFTEKLIPVGGGIIIALLSLLVVATYLTYRITKPLAILKQTARQFSEQNFSARTPTQISRRKDEFGALARTLDTMAKHTEDYNIAQHRIISDISHELRSPIARIDVANAIAQQKFGSDDTLKRIQQESARLENMISSLLNLERLNQIRELKKEHTQFDVLLKNIVDNACFEAIPLEKTITLTTPKISLLANAALLESAIENILRNALRYAKSTIDVTTTIHEDHITLRICDDGSGVPNNELGRIFKPFYRHDESRNEETGNHGIGLAIVAQVIKLHHGHVTATNRPSNGLCIEISLPK